MSMKPAAGRDISSSCPGVAKGLATIAMDRNDITEAALTKLVDNFYERVRLDPMLGPIFDGAVEDWPEHLAKLQSFWSSVMLTSGRYKGQPMPAHLKLGDAVNPAAFERWLAIWGETTASLFPAEAAAALQDKAARIAESLMLGIEFHRARADGRDPMLRTAPPAPAPLCRHEELAERENAARRKG